MDGLTHLDDSGAARMVDVSDRGSSARHATASGLVRTTAATLDAVSAGRVPKGDVAAVARIAGIQATKLTPQLVPLCHPIALHGVTVDVWVDREAGGIAVGAGVRTADRTGVEMEALTAVAIAGLAVIDMVKSLDPAATLTDVRVESKAGGRSGSWRRDEA